MLRRINTRKLSGKCDSCLQDKNTFTNLEKKIMAIGTLTGAILVAQKGATEYPNTPTTERFKYSGITAILGAYAGAMLSNRYTLGIIISLCVGTCAFVTPFVLVNDYYKKVN